MEPDTLCITKNMLEAALKQWETDAKATPNHSQEGQVILDLEDLGETLLEEVWLTLCNIRNINDETSNRNHT